MEVIAYIAIAIHVICAVGLVLFVLLHSGKGTGLSSMFGGGLPTTATGTSIIEKNLDRITLSFVAGYSLTAIVLMIVYRPGA